MILDGFAGACMIAVQYGRCTADVMRRDQPLVSGKRKTSRTLKDEYIIRKLKKRALEFCDSDSCEVDVDLCALERQVAQD